MTEGSFVYTLFYIRKNLFYVLLLLIINYYFLKIKYFYKKEWQPECMSRTYRYPGSSYPLLVWHVSKKFIFIFF